MWLWFESRYPVVLRKLRPLMAAWEAERRWTIRRILRDREKAAACTPGLPDGLQPPAALARLVPDARARRRGRDPRRRHRGTPSEESSPTTDAQSRRTSIVWCTGFTATEYLAPMRITGRGGLDIRDAWSDGPEAYLGLATPGFPNMFM